MDWRLAIWKRREKKIRWRNERSGIISGFWRSFIYHNLIIIILRARGKHKPYFHSLREKRHLKEVTNSCRLSRKTCLWAKDGWPSQRRVANEKKGRRGRETVYKWVGKRGRSRSTVLATIITKSPWEKKKRLSVIVSTAVRRDWLVADVGVWASVI